MSDGVLAFGVAYILFILLCVILVAFTWGVIALIFRPLVLWYFKINKKLQLQEETNQLLRELTQKGSMPSMVSGHSAAELRDYSAYMPK